VCAVWRQKHSLRENQVAQARKRVAELQAWREQIIKAWITEKITKDIYDDQRRKVGTELAAAGLLEGEAVLDLAEVELLLDLADWMLSHAASVWASASCANEIRIQKAVFPVGLVVSPGGFGTPQDQCAFFRLRENSDDEIVLASPGGFEPPLPP
jgi:hypothetical protein